MQAAFDSNSLFGSACAEVEPIAPRAWPEDAITSLLGAAVDRVPVHAESVSGGHQVGRVLVAETALIPAEPFPMNSPAPNAYLRVGQLENAAKHLERVLDLDPPPPPLTRNLESSRRNIWLPELDSIMIRGLTGTVQMRLRQSRSRHRGRANAHAMITFAMVRLLLYS
jgi:hypothetical protein